jgi:methylenetetrahydrofolate reductase (NADPH)
MEFKPPFIDVTTSREEFIYVDKGNGLLDKTNKNASWTLGICASITHKYNVDTASCCVVVLRRETEYLLVDCHYLGSTVALRGDAMKDEQSLSQNGWKQPLSIWFNR